MSSPGEDIYRGRVAGRLWSEAVAPTGLDFIEGLRVARRWADETGHPWPPDQGPQGKLPYSLKTTGDLRELVAAVFVRRQQGAYGIDVEAFALEARVFDRLPWDVIDGEIGCSEGQARVMAHRYLDNTDSEEWPRHKPCRLFSREHRHVPCFLYEDRLLTGDTWDVLAKRYKVSPPGRAIILAAHFADDFGLPWPVPPLDWEPSEENRSTSRAYFYRGSGLRWKAVCRLTGRPHQSSHDHRRFRDAVKWFAETHELPWPIVLPWGSLSAPRDVGVVSTMPGSR